MTLTTKAGEETVVRATRRRQSHSAMTTALPILSVLLLSSFVDARRAHHAYAEPQRVNNVRGWKHKPLANLGGADGIADGVRIVPGKYQTTVDVDFASDQFVLRGVNGIYDDDGFFSMDVELMMKRPLAGIAFRNIRNSSANHNMIDERP